MPLKALSGRLRPLLATRWSSGAAPKRWSHHEETFKGQNLPFDISNHRLFAIKYTIFMATPWAVPFIIVRYHLKKAAGK
ncbi:unnamed protein product [Medioppia subpectinata]|uniref:Cytochrome c oxidase polypeptide VIIc n=1 Tax=Medioppia subpectinata TaxID=1979941 RepID=A0A7R9Q1R2_9ACAR|nr:unnamed protein product [Medioppia subpectinata]CAG2109519.1 unnamed protein product [Medioppia subpectinata]